MTRVLIIDDHEVVRDGVKRFFDEQSADAVFGEASTALAALQLIREDEWDVVILDLSLGDRSGLDVLKEVKQIRPKLPVLILSMHSEEQYARRAFQAGASGYVTKDSSRAQMIEAINKVSAGGYYVSAALGEKLLIGIARGEDRPPHETLSDREFEVLRMIASGRTVGEIAAALSLSDKTISTYRARILVKMGLKTSAELTHYALQKNLVS